MKFTKMHGLGNDYVYVNGFDQSIPDPAGLARRISDRHFGVGSDGLILVLPSDTADVRMRMFNADGSEAEMCGNGVRCVAKFAYDHGLARRNPLRVQTGRGVLELELNLEDQKVSQVTVNMGRPILELKDIPVDERFLTRQREHVYELDLTPDEDRDEAVRHVQALDTTILEMTFVSMGNPHAITYVPNIESPNLYYLGPLVEFHKAFPRRINAHWVQVLTPEEVIMRTWERGSGETLACGTGACAVCVAGVLTGRGGRKITAHLPGGDLELEWRQSDGNVYMTGPATEVYSGDWPD